jgi:hypothetical protein
MRTWAVNRVAHPLLGALLLAFACASISYSQTPTKKDEPPTVKKDEPTPGKKDAPVAKKDALAKKAPPPKKEVAAPAPEKAWLKNDAWKGIPTTPLEPGEIDRMLEKEFKNAKVVPSAIINDEQFLRRVRLDLTGQLPTTVEIEQFLADKATDKRSKLIDKLLETDEYARHWARYWRDTVAAVEATFGDPHVPAFEDWLYEEFKQGRKWDEIVRAMLTAEGQLQRDDKEKAKKGAVFFLGRFNGPDGDIFRTAETARLFLGIQIQCAQCHDDRRTKIWHQVQFHELAGFFSRMTVGGSSGQLIKLGTKNFGEHTMPGKEADKQFITYPRFLDGKAPATTTGDADRRKALADYLTSPDNYWFSAAFANRMSAEMLGQSFFERVDDLSPKSDLVDPAVINRMAASFKGSNYDIKSLLRAIANSQAYQREVRLGDSLNTHLQFAAAFPTRLRADVLWQALSRVLVLMPTDDVRKKPFRTEFEFDPSLKSDEIYGSVGQALWMLNSQLVNDRIKFSDVRLPPAPKKNKDNQQPTELGPKPTLVKQLLTKHPSDNPAAVRDLYLQTLARKPTDKELQINLDFIKEIKQPATRNEAFEDIFKVLINSTEFQRKR